MQHYSTSNASAGVLLWMSHPYLFTGFRIDRADIGRHIAKIGDITRRVRAGQRSNPQSRPHANTYFRRPVEAAFFRVDRVQTPTLGADKDTSANHRWLRHRRIRWKAERPFDFQV